MILDFSATLDDSREISAIFEKEMNISQQFYDQLACYLLYNTK